MNKKFNYSVIGLSAIGMPFLSLLIRSVEEIGSLVLVDPDIWQKGQTHKHILSRNNHDRTAKTSVAKEAVRVFSKDQKVTTIKKSLQSASAQDAMNATDILISCVDNDLSRLDLQMFAKKHRKVLLDLSAQIIGEEKYGTVRLYVPGKTPCLICQGLKTDEIMTETLREAKINTGYLKGTDINPLSVAVLDTEVACIGISLLLSFLEENNHPTTIILNQTRHEISRLCFVSRDGCKICGQDRKNERSNQCLN